MHALDNHGSMAVAYILGDVSPLLPCVAILAENANV